MIRPSARGSHAAADEISVVIGSQQFAQNYVFKALRDAILSPYSTQLVPVSRFYMMTRPQVVVDFEPNPLDGEKFYVDEKRKFFGAHNVVYVPVFLRENLTSVQFDGRLTAERARLKQVYQEAMEDAAMAAIRDRKGELDDETMAAVDKEVHRRIEALCKKKARYGIVLTRLIEKMKRQVITEIMKERHHGRVGEILSSSNAPGLAW